MLLVGKQSSQNAEKVQTRRFKVWCTPVLYVPIKLESANNEPNVDAPVSSPRAVVKVARAVTLRTIGADAGNASVTVAIGEVQPIHASTSIMIDTALIVRRPCVGGGVNFGLEQRCHGSISSFQLPNPKKNTEERMGTGKRRVLSRSCAKVSYREVVLKLSVFTMGSTSGSVFELTFPLHPSEQVAAAIQQR